MMSVKDALYIRSSPRSRELFHMGSPATMSEKKKEELFGGTTADAVDTVDAVALTGSAEWTDRSCFENGAPLEATLDPTEYKKLELSLIHI